MDFITAYVHKGTIYVQDTRYNWHCFTSDAEADEMFPGSAAFAASH